MYYKQNYEFVTSLEQNIPVKDNYSFFTNIKLLSKFSVADLN